MPVNPQRIQLSRRKGFRLQKVSRALNGLDAVKCSRPAKYGNPFVINFDSHTNYSPRNAQEAAQWFEEYIRAQRYDLRVGKAPPTLDEIRQELRGKNLACFCALFECQECAAKFSIYPVGGCTCGAPIVNRAPCHVDTLLRMANDRSK